MSSNVVDLIIYMVKRVHIGISLQEINMDTLKGYNKSEISAAYSWLMQKFDHMDKSTVSKSSSNRPAPRVLHPSERLQVSPEVYGYLLELYYLGILDASSMERLIEYAVFQPEGIKSTSQIKQWVAGVLFNPEKEHPINNSSISLKGNETVN